METSLSSSSVVVPLDFDAVTFVVADLHTSTDSSHSVDAWMGLEGFLSTFFSVDSTVTSTGFILLMDSTGDSLVVITSLVNSFSDSSRGWVNMRFWDNWSSDLMDNSSSLSDSSCNSSDGFSKRDNLSSDDWSSWSWGSSDLSGQLSNSLLDVSDSLSQNSNSLSQSSNSLLFFWLKFWSLWFFLNRFNWFSWRNDLMNNSSNGFDLSGNSSDSLSEDSDLSSDNRSFSSWGRWKSSLESDDLLSDNSDSLGQLIDSLSESLNNGGNFLSWSWLSWFRGWSMGDLSDSSSDMSDSLSDVGNSLGESDNSLSDNWSSLNWSLFNGGVEVSDFLTDSLNSLG